MRHRGFANHLNFHVSVEIQPALQNGYTAAIFPSVLTLIDTTKPLIRALPCLVLEAGASRVEWDQSKYMKALLKNKSSVYL